MNRVRLLLCLLLLLPVSLNATEAVVLVTIKPLAWLVHALVPGVPVEVLVPDGQSPHDYQLRPADVARISRSDLLVWVGPGLEPWLVQVADRLPAARQQVLLPRSLHEHDEHGHVDEHAIDEDHAIDRDPHLWLDPLALAEQAPPLAAQLKRLYPAQSAAMDNNLAQFLQQMQALDAEIAALFAPVAPQGFVVYHDGYQRLVQRYRLNQRAAVWQHESIPPGARERAALLTLLNSGEVPCLFYEPEHGAEAVSQWLGHAAATVNMVQLDVLGQQVPVGADSYPRFLRGLAGRMADCLAAQPRNRPDKP